MVALNLKLARTSLALASFVAMTACAGEEQGDFAPVCPHVDVVPHAADLYQFKAETKNVHAPAFHVSLTGIAGSCTAAPKKSVRSRVSVRVYLERGAFDAPINIDLPYFVAVTRDDKVLDKKTFTLHLSLPADEVRRVKMSPLRYIDVPASPDLQDTNYALKIGIQLTPQQLQYNREHLISGYFRKTGR